MNFRIDYYRQLGLRDFASKEEVKAAYRKLAMKHHPDRGGKKENMQALNYIYELLTKHKEQYDAWLEMILLPTMVVETTFSGSSNTVSWSYTSWTL